MEIETLDDIVGFCFYRKCSVLLNGSAFLLSRLFTKLAATILKVCKLVSSSLLGRLRKSWGKFSRWSIVSNDLDFDCNSGRLAAKIFYRFKAVIWLSQRLLFKRLEFPASLRSLLWQTKGFFLVWQKIAKSLSFFYTHFYLRTKKNQAK